MAGVRCLLRLMPRAKLMGSNYVGWLPASMGGRLCALLVMGLLMPPSFWGIAWPKMPWPKVPRRYWRPFRESALERPSSCGHPS